jgi:signal transduction histidine kinase
VKPNDFHRVFSSKKTEWSQPTQSRLFITVLLVLLPALCAGDTWQGLYPVGWPSLSGVEERIEERGGEAAATAADLWQRALLSRTQSDRLAAERAAAHAQQLSDAGDSAEALRFLILGAWGRLGFDRSRAIRQLDEIAELPHLAKDTFAKGLLQMAIAERFLWTDDHRATQAALIRAKTAFEDSGHPEWQALAHTRQLLSLNKFTRFDELRTTAEAIARDAEGLALAQALYWKGEALLGTGRVNESIQLADTVFDILREYEPTALTIAALSLRARAHLANANPHLAKAHSQEAIRTAHHLGRLDLIADLKTELALAHLQMGHKDAAEQAVRQAVERHAAHGADRRRAVPHILFAEMAMRKNDFTRAKIHFQRARVYALLGQREWRIRIYEGLYETARREGDASEALRHFTRASELRKQLHESIWEERLRTNTAELEEMSRSREAAAFAQTENFRAESRRQEARIRNLLLLGMVLSLLLVFLLWHRYTAQREQNRLLLLAAQKARQAEIRETEANRAKTEFLANITHEFRTPLNGIIGMASLLQETQLDADQKECVRIVHDCGNNLLRIIGDILDLSRIEAGHFLFDAHVFDLPASLRAIIEKYARIVPQRGVAWSAEISPEIPRYVFGEESRVRQIVESLLDNAIKFTPKGFIRLRVTSSLERSAEGEDRVSLECLVEDSGIGISSQLQGEIFRAFRQADLSNTRQYSGAGLGLTMAHRLSELMGGSVRCESEEGKGSRFTATLSLPVRPNGPRATGESSLPPVRLDRLAATNSGNSRETERTIRVLLFRVGRNLRTSLGSALESLGLPYEASNEGDHLREAISSRAADIVFLRLTEDDWADTIDWIEELLEENVTPTTPAPYLIGLDATGIPNVVKSAFAAGFDEVIPTRGSAARLPTVLLKTGLFSSGIS